MALTCSRYNCPLIVIPQALYLRPFRILTPRVVFLQFLTGMLFQTGKIEKQKTKRLRSFEILISGAKVLCPAKASAA